MSVYQPGPLHACMPHGSGSSDRSQYAGAFWRSVCSQPKDRHIMNIPPRCAVYGFDSRLCHYQFSGTRPEGKLLGYLRTQRIYLNPSKYQYAVSSLIMPHSNFQPRVLCTYGTVARSHPRIVVTPGHPRRTPPMVQPNNKYFFR